MTNKHKIKKQIMEKIEKNEVKMRPRWWFVAQVEALHSLTIILFMAGALVFSAAVFLVEQNTPLDLLQFGDVGRELIVEDFPYLFFGGGLLLAASSILLTSRLGDNYKKPLKLIIFTTATVIIGITLLLSLFRASIGLEQILSTE